MLSAGIRCGSLSDELSVAPVGWPGEATIIRARAAMQQIADWLEKLGMPEYAQRFAENGIV